MRPFRPQWCRQWWLRSSTNSSRRFALSFVSVSLSLSSLSPSLSFSQSRSYSCFSQRPLGGSYNYLPLPPQDYSSLAWAAVIGLVAGLHAFAFIIYVKSLKALVHRVELDKFPLLLSLLGGSLVGLCGVLSPAALFWGEHELQWAVQMGASSVQLPYAQSPGLIPLDAPLTMWQNYFVGMMKVNCRAF